MGASPSLAQSVQTLAKTFSGELLQPRDPGYDEARRIHNGLVDKRPALIARCGSTGDLVQAVNLARDHGLDLAVRGGGHNVAGRAVIDDGLMIDLSLMKDIRVDAKARTVRAQGGVTWGEFNEATQRHGLATTGGIVSTTGIAGLTLGGGLGYLMGKYGLAADNLLSVEIVTADGRVRTASREQNPDLFWAVRGGGGNFGIVASLEYRLHPVGPTVTGGLILHPLPNARDALRFYRDFSASLPDELTVHGGVAHAPDGSGAKLVGFLVCHCGALAEGEAAVRPLKSFGSPVMDLVGPTPYSQVNMMLDAAYPKGARNYWKSKFLADLTDDAIDAMIECVARCPAPMGDVVVEHVHGAATRVGVSNTAFPHRAGGYSLLVLSQWMNPADDQRCIAWARESFATMRPFMRSGGYVNYLDHDDAGDPVAAAYGPNHHRLQKLKAKYDPENVFHMNQNIRPLS